MQVRALSLALQSVLAMALCGAVWAQARRVTPPQEVASLSELRPKTADQIARSKLWTLGGAPLPLLTEFESRRMRMQVEPMEAIALPGYPDPNALDQRVCQSAVVVFGKTMKAQALLNASETLLFTDFQVEVEAWIRPPTGGSPIQVTIGGGRALIGGKALIEIDYGVFLEVEQRYALFLRWAPDVKTHFLNWDPLPIAGGMVILPDGKLQPEAEFLTRLKTFASKCKA